MLIKLMLRIALIIGDEEFNNSQLTLSEKELQKNKNLLRKWKQITLNEKKLFEKITKNE